MARGDLLIGIAAALLLRVLALMVASGYLSSLGLGELFSRNRYNAFIPRNRDPKSLSLQER
ncbi:MAG: hypothetical protein Q6K80_03240 [Thermostichus sp. DG_1_6_bins_120]